MPPRLALRPSLLRTLHNSTSHPSSFFSIRRASILSSLSDTRGAYNKRIRRGRGPASGKGKTSGRGQKGQRAHGKVPAGFEGGQTPQWITNPPRGREAHNPFKVEMSPINLDRIQTWIDAGRLDPDRLITVRELHRSRCLHGVKKHGVKVLARNASLLTSKIHLIVSRASTEAIARIEALGGTITTRFYSPSSLKRVLRGTSHPTISLQASSSLITLSAEKQSRIASSSILTSLAEGKPRTVDKETMTSIMQGVRQQYKYRLPDATSRKDIEYYRDRKHRGYLAHLVTRKETPSLYWHKPRKIGATAATATKKKAAAKEENRLF